MNEKKLSATSPIRASVLTSSGRSAVAVVGVLGHGGRAVVESCLVAATPGPLSRGQVRYGLWTGDRQSQGTGESVVVTIPRDDLVEIHCHGGPAATERILDHLVGHGACAITSDEFLVSMMTPRAIAEAQQAAAECLTPRTVAIAMDQFRGALVEWCRSAKTRLGNGDVDSVLVQADAMLGRAPVTSRLGSPFRVVLVGPPNVGKSSLVNAIVGYDRSITMDAPGTTRDVLHAETVIDGFPVRISDTAGIRETGESIEREGISMARSAIDSADLVIRVREAGASHVEIGQRSSIDVVNKVDLAADPVKDASLPTIATTGHGVDQLLAAISCHFAESTPEPGMPALIHPRQVDVMRRLAEAKDIDTGLRAIDELIG